MSGKPPRAPAMSPRTKLTGARKAARGAEGSLVGWDPGWERAVRRVPTEGTPPHTHTSLTPREPSETDRLQLAVPGPAGGPLRAQVAHSV